MLEQALPILAAAHHHQCSLGICIEHLFDFCEEASFTQAVRLYGDIEQSPLRLGALPILIRSLAAVAKAVLS